MNQTPSRNGAAIEIRETSKFYGGFTALDNVNLRVEPGEFMSFLGPSGSGKTTTLNLIAGFTEMDRGDIRIGDRSIGNVPAHKRNIGVVFQHYALFPHKTVAANVAYPLKVRGIGRSAREAAARQALQKVHLENFAHRYPSELSGGQQQRVALARAMVFDPSLLLMDEPLGALDKRLREVLQLEIKRIHRELGSTFVYVTHDQEEALVLSDRIAVFNHGKIEQVGTGLELYNHPATLFVGQFIGESSVLRGAHRSVGGETALDCAGSALTAAGTARPGQCHVILVRPEAMTVQTVGTGSADGRSNILRGTVRETLYLGSAIKYEVLLADGNVAVARVATQGAPFDIGQHVELAWRPADCTLLADDGSTGEH